MLLDAEPVAFWVIHLDPCLPGHPRRISLIGGTQGFKPSSLCRKKGGPKIRSHVPVNRIDVNVKSLVGGATVIALKQDAGPGSGWINDRRNIVSLLVGYSDSVGKGLPRDEPIRWRLEHIGEGGSPEACELGRVVASDHNLYPVRHDSTLHRESVVY